MTNLFAFTDPCEPMCDMCTPLEMTPIYVQLKAECEEREEYYGWPTRIMLGVNQGFYVEQFKRERLGEWKPDESTASVEILPDTTKFRESMRVGGRRSGRSAEWDRLMQWALYGNSLIPTLEVIKYPAAVHELSRTTGWSLEESADMYQRVAKWSADAITEVDIKALGRSRMSKPNHYPTSSPAWARRKR